MLYVQQQGYATGGIYRIDAGIQVDDETCIARPVAVLSLKPADQLERESPVDGASEHLVWSRNTFERARRMWASLPPHPNIIRALEASRHQGVPNLILEFVFGPSLTNLRERVSTFTAMQVLVHGARALAFLHADVGVVHGDLNTNALMFDGDGHVKLGMLGHCHSPPSLRSDAPEWQRQPHPNQGGAWPIPPEIHDGDEWSAASDVWALACCIVQILAGKPGEKGHAFDPLACLGALGLPNADPSSQALLFLLTNMLRPDPKDRTQNGMKLGVALRDHAADDLARLRRREEILGKMRWNHPGLEELTEIERELAEIERWTCPAWMPYASRFALGSAALHTGPGRASATRALEYAREAMRLHPHEPRLDLLFDDAYQALVETGGSGTTVLGAGRGEILADRLEHLLVSLDSFNTYTTQERVRAVMGELANLGDRAGAEHPHRDLLHRARRLLDSIENHAAHELRALHDQLMDRW